MARPTVDTRPAWRRLAPLSGLPDSLGHAVFVVLARHEQAGDPVPLGTEQQSRDASHARHLLGSLSRYNAIVRSAICVFFT
jgi:hypothetical protein